MKRLNNKGLTLIELLAVVIVLGIMMLVALPALGGIRDNAKKKAFLASGKSYISSAQVLVAADDVGDVSACYTISAGDISPMDEESPITGTVFYYPGATSVKDKYKAYITDGKNYAIVTLDSNKNSDVKDSKPRDFDEDCSSPAGTIGNGSSNSNSNNNNNNNNNGNT